MKIKKKVKNHQESSQLSISNSFRIAQLIRLRILQTLLDHGAHVDVKDGAGMQPIFSCRCNDGAGP
jgi:hypothetical protein